MNRMKSISFVSLGLLTTLGLLCGCASKPVSATEGPDGMQTVKVVVRGGYNPQEIVAKADKPLRVEFFRDEEPSQHSCGEEVVIPGENVKMKLPARESQIVEIKPQPSGSELAFKCGMDMLHGKITFK